MTTFEKLAMLKSFLKITGTASDTELSMYLDFAKREFITWRYGLCRKPPIAHAKDSYGNMVFVESIGTFIAAITPTSGTSYVFTYSVVAESWQYSSTDVELSDYGLSVTGVRFDGEAITVKYTEMPMAEYDTLLIMACVVGYGLSGAEGQIAHNENGINRSFKYADMVEYIHRNAPAYVAVI